MRSWRTIGLMAVDAACLVAAAVSAFLLRFDAQVPPRFWVPFWPTFPLTIAAFLLACRRFHLYQRIWRFASLETIASVAKATTAGVVAMIVLQFATRASAFPRGVIIMTWVLAAVFVGGVRLALRLQGTRRAARQKMRSRDREPEDRPVLVVGAGEAGVMVVDGMRSHPEMGYRPVGFVDDDPHKLGTYVAGVRVLGSRAQLPELLSANRIKEVVIALPRASGGIVRSIVEECAKHRVPAKIVPNIVEIISRSLDPFNLREVQVEDLLRRPPVKVDLAASSAQLHGRRVLITGAGGSIGSELAHQVLPREPALLVLLGHGEHSIQSLHRELGESRPDLADRVVAVIGDIQDRARIDQILAQHRPDLVFHAAAHKHVPLMESHPCEAVKNNVIGTQTLMEAASRHGVGRVVLISTDKAVRPTNIMGASKRLAELILQAAAIDGNGTVFTMVRFGNVLDSSGSVVKTFRRQIRAGGPVTVTHPQIIRYFMSIPEAAELVIQAGAMAKGGEVFVLDMGEPVRIDDLARLMVRLMGLEVKSEENPDADIAISYTGLRPGEKLYEELLVGANTSGTEHARIQRSDEPFLSPAELDKELEVLEAAMKMRDIETIQTVLRRSVEGYRAAMHATEGEESTHAAWTPPLRTLH